MSELTYRLAVASDAAQLCSVARACFIDAFGQEYAAADLQAGLTSWFSPELQRREIEDPEQLHRLAVDAEGRIVGFITLGSLKLPVPDPLTPALEVRRLYVVRARQGRRVGDELMRWALDEARARRAASVYLGVWRHNHGAQRFYRRYGFEKVGEYLFPVGAHRDEEDILLLPLR